MLKYSSSQKGVSLIEIMVSIVIGLILLAGVMNVFLRVSTSSGDSIQSNHLNQQLRTAMDFMTRELQRAGHVRAWSGTDISGDGMITVLDLDLDAITLFGEVATYTSAGASCETSCACVLYSYDIDRDGLQDVGTSGTVTDASLQSATSPVEQLGFRLNSGVIQMRTGGSSFTCTGGDWEDITDNTINVTTLEFDLDYTDTAGVGSDATVYAVTQAGRTMYDSPASCTPSAVADDITAGTAGTKCLIRRKLNIAVGGSLSATSAVTLEMRNEVKVKNDHFKTL